MFYQEKRTIATTISGIILMVAYIIYSIVKWQEIGDELLNDLGFWANTMLVFLGIGIGLIIVILIFFHIFLAISQEMKKKIINDLKKEIPILEKRDNNDESFDCSEFEETDDEMEKLISLKAMEISYVFVGIGFVTALITLSFKMPPAIMLNTIFISFMLGSIVEGLSKFYFYRRGVRNG